MELSFLPGDTGKPDVFSASPRLPHLKQEGRDTEAEEREHKGEGEMEERKRQKRKEKSSGKEQEEAPLPSRETKEPQRPRAKKPGKRPHPESASEQVRPSGRVASPRERENLSEAAGQLPSL